MPALPRSSIIAGRVFSVLAALGAAHAAAILLLRAYGYGTLPLAAVVLAQTVAAAWCAAAVRRGQARGLGAALVAWGAAGCGVLLTFVLTYRPGPRFYWISAAALAWWVVAGLRVSRRWQRGIGRSPPGEASSTFATDRVRPLLPPGLAAASDCHPAGQGSPGEARQPTSTEGGEGSAAVRSISDSSPPARTARS